ncbi:MAG: hypothetical protein JWM27_78 [Gemmatimonadetes bacterium]|nr:hypothetical protein [Gemmatimonadota bacterium]
MSTNPQDIPLPLTAVDRGGAVFNVRGFGAVGDGTTDDTAAINAAIAAAELVGGTVLFPPVAIGYVVSSTITFPATVSPDMRSPVLDSRSTAVNLPCLVWGSASTVILHLRGQLRAVRTNLSDWTDEGCVGVRIYNAQTCPIAHVQAERFTVGVQMVAASANLLAYCELGCSRLVDNKIGLDLTATGGGANNGCTFSRWRFAVNSGTHTGLSRYGVRITHDGTCTPLNEHLFVGCSFELSGTAITDPTKEVVPVLLEHAWQCTWWNYREEGNYLPGGSAAAAIFVRITNDSQDNEFRAHYGFANVDEQGTKPSSIYFARTTYLTQQARQVFDSGAVWRNAIVADGSSTWSVQRCGIGNSSVATVYAHNAGWTLGSTYLQTTSAAVGVRVDTTAAKRLTVKLNTLAGYGGQVIIRCYDSAGAVLDGSATTYVKTHGGAGVFWSTNYGGVYYSGSNVGAPGLYFVVDAAVAEVWIGVVAGSTGTVRLRSFSVYSVDGASAACDPGFREIAPGANHGTAAPASGTWATGSRIVNVAPSSTAPSAWVCTAGGTPGTWVPYVGAATGITSLPNQATPITIAANQSGYGLDVRNPHASGSGVLIRAGSDSNNSLAVVDAATGGTVRNALFGSGQANLATGGGAVTVGATTNTRAARLKVSGKAEFDSDIHMTAGGGADLATTAVVGFFQVSTCNGTPSGTPTNVVAGCTPMLFDRAAKKWWAYTGGTWLSSPAFT